MLNTIVAMMIELQTEVAREAVFPKAARRAPMVCNRSEVSGDELRTKVMNVCLIDHEETINHRRLNRAIEKEIEPFKNQGMEVKRSARLPPLHKHIPLREVGYMKWPRNRSQRLDKVVSLNIPRGEKGIPIMFTSSSSNRYPIRLEINQIFVANTMKKLRCMVG